MFDIGWSELVIIAVVALVVIGPKELPATLRTIGKMTARARKVAGDFAHSSMKPCERRIWTMCARR